MGRPSILSLDNQHLVLAHATLSADNGRKSLVTIAEDLEIHVHEHTFG